MDEYISFFNDFPNCFLLGKGRGHAIALEAALKIKAEGHYVIADFIAPTPKARSLFPSDFRVWVDTIKEGRFEDTNQMFVNPKNFDFHVTTQDAKYWAPKIIEEIKK